MPHFPQKLWSLCHCHSDVCEEEETVFKKKMVQTLIMNKMEVIVVVNFVTINLAKCKLIYPFCHGQ